MDVSRIHRLVQQAVSDGFFPGAVLLVARGRKICLENAYGVTDIFSRRAATLNTVYDLASLTKPLVTAMSLLVMADEQKIFPGQEIGNILKDFKDTDKSSITIDMLMRHTSGLPAHIEFYKEICPGAENGREKLRKLLLKTPLAYAPGKCQVYSDLGYMVLSWIVETICGQRIDRFAADRIFKPLGAEPLFFIDHFTPGRTEALRKRYEIAPTQQCPWRNKLLRGEVDDDNAWAAGGIEGHAGLFGTAGSVYALCSELLEAMLHNPCRLLNPEVLAAFTEKKDDFGMVAGFDTPSRLGSSAGRYFGRSSIGHLGFTGTSFWIDPEQQLIVIFLTNRVHPSRDNQKIKKFRPVLHDAICSIL